MTPEERARLADRLADAYATGQPIDPPSETGTITLEDAYGVQSLQVERWRSSDARILGHKVGLTARAMQQMLGVDRPDYGHLMDTMFLPPGEPVPASRFIQVRVEPEIAFVLGRDLRGPGVTHADALRSVDFALAALELIDSRVKDWRIRLVDTIADNASSAAVVLGARPVLPRDIDFRLAGCNLWRNGALVATGAGGAVLGDPISALAWLANTLGQLGTTLQAGEVILPGSCTAAIPVSPGDSVRAELAGLGPVSVTFEKDEKETG